MDHHAYLIPSTLKSLQLCGTLVGVGTLDAVGTLGGGTLGDGHQGAEMC